MRLAAAACVTATPGALATDPANRPPLALRGVNPDLLSGGVFASLDAQGAFGPPASARARAAYANLGKGRPGVVLDSRIGVNVRLGDDPDPLPSTQRGQSEPHLVRSAARSNLLLATFQEGRFALDGGAVGNGYAVSRDGGMTWRRALVPALTTASGGPYPRATDPVAAIGPQEDLYLNALASLDRAFGLSAVVVQRSVDDGITWTAPTVIYQSPNAQTFPDKNWLAVNDYPGAPFSGRLVATWTMFTSTAAGSATGNHVVAAISDDRGATWTPPIDITPGGSRNQGTQPVFLPDGSLGVVYITFLNSENVTQFSINFKRSPDGGRTFPAAETTVVGFVPGWDDPELRDGVFLPAATVARDTGALFVTYTAVAAGTPRVMVTRSLDRGLSWTPPVPVSDQPAGRSVSNPAIAASPDGRTVSVVFIDKRNAPGGRGFVDLTAALSFDGGASWPPNLRLTEVSSDLSHGPPTNRGVMLGDYLAVVPGTATDPAGLAIWCDTRTGDSDPFAVRFTPAREPGFDAWRAARFAGADYRDAAQSGPAADPDGDGVQNLVEFDQGTDPRKPDFGESLVVSRPTSDLVDVAALARAEPANVSTTFAAAEVPLVSPVSTPPPLPEPGFTATVGAAAAPAVAPPPGLIWRTVQFRGTSGKPALIGRSAMLTTTAAGIPPMTAIEFGASSERPTSRTNSRLVNIATRARVGGAADPLIVGFVLDGAKTMLLRAVGPTLGAFGVAAPLPNPHLTLSRGDSPAESLVNDDWMAGGATPALFARLGAFALPANSRDAAIVQTLGAGTHTVMAADVDSRAAGVALVEAYDGDPMPGLAANPRLLNVSARGDVGSGENALIAGFVVGGTLPRRILLRAIGPSLAAFGVAGALADPQLALYRGATLLGVNDDWEISRSGAAVAATGLRLGAFALPPASLDSALLITLAPGTYTVVVTPASGGTGVALVEVYDAD